MLSYLKEGNETQAETDLQQPQADGQEQSLSKQEDYFTVSGHGKKLRQSTIILAALFAVGAAGVWFMIQKTTPATADAATSEDQAQLDAALAQLDKMQSEMNTQMDSVVGRFYQFSNVNQVGVNELKKNPFQREFEINDVEEDAGQSLANERKYLQEQAYKQSTGLQLWSITGTPKGMCCMIDDKVLYEGDTIRGMTVKTIGKKKVVLEYKGMPVELKMD